MEALPKELKKVIQLTQDSLKSFEYIIMVMDDRIKVEDNYLNGLNKVQAQFNFIKENDPLAFECSALKVDVSQKANHNLYFVEQMKAEQEEMKQLLKKTQERTKEVNSNIIESEKVFKQRLFDLEKQKEKLTFVSKELEDMCLYFQLIDTDVSKQNAKWKDKKFAVYQKLRSSYKAKEELEGSYRAEVKSFEEFVVDYNKQLITKYDELVIQSNDLRNSIHDLARKQLVFEVNQIRNIQYDLDNVIKQVDSRPSFAYPAEEVSQKLNPHRELSFKTFFSSFQGDILKRANETPLELEQTFAITPSPQLPGMDSNFDCITKEERTTIQNYFQKGLIDNLNQLSMIKNQKLKEACHYLMNSVIKNKGDSIDVDVLNSDISIIISEIQSRTAKNKSLHKEQNAKRSEEGKKSQSSEQIKEDLEILKEEALLTEVIKAAEEASDKKQEQDQEGKKPENEKQITFEEKSEGISSKDLKEVEEVAAEVKVELTEVKEETSEVKEETSEVKEETSEVEKVEKKAEDATNEQVEINETEKKDQVEEEGKNKKEEQPQEIKAEESKDTNEVKKEDGTTSEVQENKEEIKASTEKQEEPEKPKEEQANEKSEEINLNEEINLHEEKEGEKKEEKKEETQVVAQENEANKKPVESEESKQVEKDDRSKSQGESKDKIPEKQEKEKEEQEEITEEAPIFFDYTDEQNQAIFLIFLECFRQSGKSQITPSQNNQLVIECFRYLDDLSIKKDILQLIKFMPLTFAIYRLTAAEKVFIQEKVKHHALWTHNDVWESLIFRSVREELTKLDPSIADDESVYRNTVYSNLATIGLNMLKFRSTKQNTKNLLAKLAYYYGIPDQQSTELTTFIENEGQNEKSLSFVKTSNFSAKPNMTKGRIITFGQQPQQQQQPVQAPTPATNTTNTSFNNNSLQDSKVNPLLQRPSSGVYGGTQPQQNNVIPNNQPRQFQSTFTPSNQAPKPLSGGQVNPLLQQQAPPTKHVSEFKPSNLFKADSTPTSNTANNNNTPTQEGSATKPAVNPNQPIPQFANQQVPIQAQQQKQQVNLPTNKVNSRLFGEGQNFALNNKNL